MREGRDVKLKAAAAGGMHTQVAHEGLFTQVVAARAVSCVCYAADSGSPHNIHLTHGSLYVHCSVECVRTHTPLTVSWL